MSATESQVGTVSVKMVFLAGALALLAVVLIQLELYRRPAPTAGEPIAPPQDQTPDKDPQERPAMLLDNTPPPVRHTPETRVDALSDQKEESVIAASEPEEPAATETFEERYKDWSMVHLVGQREILHAELLSRMNRLFEERYEQGLFDVRSGEWSDDYGGYIFTSNPEEPFRMRRSIPGIFDRMEVVELPFDEYPDLYALDKEMKWVGSKSYAMQAKANKQ